jgi:2-C-methyl-D-erythritol 4-phosphate cytidylyltransferase
MNMIKLQKVAAIIVAAGAGRRMGGFDKVLGALAGEPLLVHATRPFQQCPAVSQIVIVVSGEKERQCRAMVAGPEWSKVTDICLGGDRRQDSVAAGLKRLREFDWVIIHDGARPLVTVDLIERGLAAARETGAAAAAVPVTDTIKVVDDSEIVRQTLPRQNLRAVQTPQVFRFDVIQIAHYQDTDDVTDDASLVERLGHKVKLYMGAHDNIKVTTPADLALAEILLRRREL